MKMLLSSDFGVWNKEQGVIENTYDKDTLDWRFANLVITCLGELEEEGYKPESPFLEPCKRELAGMRGYLIVELFSTIGKIVESKPRLAKTISGIFNKERTTYNHYKRLIDEEDSFLVGIVAKSRFGRRIKSHTEAFLGKSGLRLEVAKKVSFTDLESLIGGCPSCRDKLERFFLGLKQ